MASVAKREWTHKDETKTAWVVRYTDQGGKRRMKTFDKKKDADRYRTHVEVEIEQGVHTASRASVTMAEAAEAYVDDCVRRHHIGDEMSGETLRSKTRIVRLHIVPLFGRRVLAEIRASDVQLWIDQLSVKYARASIEAFLRDFSSILAFSVRRGWLKRNVLRDEPPRLPNIPVPDMRFPSIEELKKLLVALEGRIKSEQWLSSVNRRAIVYLGIFAGMRIGEILGLQWKFVDFNTETLGVRHSQSEEDGLKGPKTRAGVRDIPMSDLVRVALLEVLRYRQQHDSIYSEWKGAPRERRAIMLRSWKEGGIAPNLDRKPGGYVFISRTSKPLSQSNVRRAIYEAQDLAGIPGDGGRHYTPHSLRHAAVSLFLREGMPLLPLSAMIGHSKPSVTLDVYGHIFPEDTEKLRTVQRIGTQFSATTPQHKHLTTYTA